MSAMLLPRVSLGIVQVARAGWLALLAASLAPLPASACPDAPPRGTGDLGLVVERAAGSLRLIETTHMSELARIEGLGDLSHASLVYSRDGRFA